ncbi:MAG: hypothetical protein J6D03_09925 [Clostridia bacterium]|nr:hypothetical protein [Clostridia bacterium]
MCNKCNNISKSDNGLHIGDWVETCHMLPGIVTYINEKDPDDICAWIPGVHKAGECGGCHSIKDCGVHKISGSYARILLAIGEEKLKQLWKVFITKLDDNETWDEFVTSFYKVNYGIDE